MITCVTKRRKDFSKKIIEIVNNNLKDKLQVHWYKLKNILFPMNLNVQAFSIYPQLFLLHRNLNYHDISKTSTSFSYIIASIDVIMMTGFFISSREKWKLSGTSRY